MSAADGRANLPRLPVLGWAAFRGDRAPSSSSILESPHLVYTTSGRAAIALALQQLGVQRGDLVLVPTYHCPTMISPVAQIGAHPLFFPITRSGSPAIDWLHRQALGRVRVMLVAHYFGIPQPMAEVRRFCDERGIALIEDCAHALFGASEGKPIGAWGDLAIASLTKFYPVSEGGCLVSGARALDGVALAPRSITDEIRALVDTVEGGARHGRFPGVNALLRALLWLKDIVRRRARRAIAYDADGSAAPPSVHDYSDELVGSRLTHVSQWIVESARRSRIIAVRRRNFDLLARSLSDLPAASPFATSLPEGSAPYVFPLRVANPEDRYKALRAAGVPIFRWDRIWPGMPEIPGDEGLVWATEIFQVGCHQDLTAEDVLAIADTVRRVFEQVR